MRNFIKGAAAGFVLAGTLIAATPAKAEIIIEGPSAEFVATHPPVYYEGRPAYWYGNRWYYREGPGWRAYRDEPVYLHDWRYRHPVVERRYYEGRRGHGWGYRHEGWRR